MVGPEGKDAAELRAELMLVATGRAANIEDIGLETTKVETDRGIIKVNGQMRTKEPHVYAIGDIVGGLWLAHTAAHEGIIAAHTIAGETDVHEMDYDEAAARDVLPAGDRLDRADRGAGARSAGRESRSARSRSRRSPRRSSAASTRASRRSSPTRRPSDTLGVHIVGPHATDLIAEASLALSARGDAVGDRRGDARAPDAVRGHRRGRDGGRRAVASTSRPVTAPAEATRSRDGGEQGTLAPRRVGRPDRRRPHRDVPARRARPRRRRADVDPQPGRPDPVRHQRPGPRGRPGRHRLGVREGPRLDRAVLPLDRDLPDVRDERARHHDRPVRDGQRPVVGRPPDARPLRQRTSTTSSRSRRRSRPSCCTRSGSPSRPRSARPARSR